MWSNRLKHAAMQLQENKRAETTQLAIMSNIRGYKISFCTSSKVKYSRTKCVDVLFSWLRNMNHGHHLQDFDTPEKIVCTVKARDKEVPLQVIVYPPAHLWQRSSRFPWRIALCYCCLKLFDSVTISDTNNALGFRKNKIGKVFCQQWRNWLGTLLDRFTFHLRGFFVTTKWRLFALRRLSDMEVSDCTCI